MSELTIITLWNWLINMHSFSAIWVPNEMKLKDLVHQLLVLRLYFAQGKYQRSLLFGIANLVKCSITPTSLFTKHIYSFINSTERHTNKIKKRTRPETNIMNTRNFGTNKINSNSQSIISIERNIKTYKVCFILIFKLLQFLSNFIFQYKAQWFNSILLFIKFRNQTKRQAKMIEQFLKMRVN